LFVLEYGGLDQFSGRVRDSVSGYRVTISELVTLRTPK